MKKKRGRRIAMLLAMMMLIMNLIVSPVWAGPGDVAINETNFPNYYFRNYVSKKLDKDHDGKLSDAEIAGIKSIDVRDIYLIKNLKGIEYFTALQTLNCDGNRLSTLDISKNAALQKLVCSNNQLTNLDVSNNPALEYLYCGANQLTNLDVSNNPALEYLYCGATQLTNLDVSNNPALKYLNCGNNRLKNLDVSNSPALQTLHCDANFLTNLDVSNNSALEYLYCEANKLTNLDVSKNPALQTLHCYSNKLTSLDVSKNPALQELRCGLNKLTSLDISNNSALQKLECDNNKLTSLDISKNSALQKLDCNHNQLTNLDLSNNPALQKLECWTNQLTNLDLSNNPALQQLGCSKNQLTSLDISKNTALKDLYCSENQLTSLDVSKNTALEYIDCSENQLTSFDVSKNTALEDLYCSENQLTNLDVSNPALETLDCGNNQLTNLDLSKNSALWSLNCIKNKLTVLDVSKNTALGELRCYNNQLTNLDLSNNTRISDFDGDNQTYDVKVKTSDMKIVYTDFPGNFDITKATDDIEGADSNFIVDASKPSTVTYDYDTGLRGRYFEVTLNITYVYTVTFNTNGGSAVNPQTITAGEHVTKPAAPTKDGYTFAGWYKDAEFTTAFDFVNETINADTTIYAKWTQNAPASYTVTFNTNGGSAVSAQTIAPGEHVQKPTDPTKDGYTFAGWYKDAEFTTAFDFANETINADTTLYAKWTQNAPPTPVTYTLTASVDGGHGSVTPTNATKNKNETVTLTFTPETGYEIEEVKVNDVATPVSGNTLTLTMDGDKTVVVKYKATPTPPPTPVTYTLTASVDGGHGSVTPTNATKNKNETVTLTFTPETGYEIEEVKVNDVVTPVSGNTLTLTMDGDKTVVVKYKATPTPPPTPVTYTLTASVEGGHGSVTPTNATKNKNETVTLTFTPETGYEIEEVKVNDVATPVSGNTLTLTMDGDKTVVVKYKATPTPPPTPVTYTLTASVDGGHGSVTPTSKTVNKDETVTLTFTPETGYELDTVTVNGTAVGVMGNVLDVTMNENKTVIVKFKAVGTPPIVTPVTITFDKNGGTGTMADVTKNKGESFTLPACTFTPPAGKEFKAWQVDGTEKNVGDNIVLNGDKIIKAVWKDIGSLPPTPPVPPTPPTPNPWIVYPGYWYNEIEAPKAKEKPVNSIEIDWKLELTIGIDVLNREINGVQSKIKMDIAPYIKEGRTMLPVRYVAEALGFDVDWNESTRTVILKEGSTRVEIPVDTNQIIVNGKVYTSDVKPEIINGRTMLPIANIARALGLQDGKDIIWNSQTNKVTIYRSILVK